MNDPLTIVKITINFQGVIHILPYQFLEHFYPRPLRNQFPDSYCVKITLA